MKKKRLVIVPAYNEAGNIEKTITDIEEHAKTFDYIIINDCSKDDTQKICEERGYHVINLPVNLGIGGGVQTGYMYALRNGYEIAVQIDGDGQHNAKYLDAMADKLESEKLDMLIGSRFIENEGFQSSFLRRVGIRYFTIFIKMLTGKTVTDPTSGMRVVNRKVIEDFVREYPKDYPEPESVASLLKRGYRIQEQAVMMNEREEGASSISAINSIYYMIKVSFAILIAVINK